MMEAFPCGFFCVIFGEAENKDSLYHSFSNPLNGLSSAHLSLAHFGMKFCLEGLFAQQRKALYCPSTLGLIKENEPGDLGKRCLIKKSTLN